MADRIDRLPREARGDGRRAVLKGATTSTGRAPLPAPLCGCSVAYDADAWAAPIFFSALNNHVIRTRADSQNRQNKMVVGYRPVLAAIEWGDWSGGASAAAHAAVSAPCLRDGDADNPWSLHVYTILNVWRG